MQPLKFANYGLAEAKSPIFGQYAKLPAEIGRGGTSAKLYFYDTEFKTRTDDDAASVIDGVTQNHVSWWEVQLYSLTECDLRRCPVSDDDWREWWSSSRPLNFGSEATRLRMTIDCQLEQYAAEARNRSDTNADAIATALARLKMRLNEQLWGTALRKPSDVVLLNHMQSSQVNRW